MSLLDLHDRTAVVFGGTSGLGREIALGLARTGANVIATGRRADLVQRVSEKFMRWAAKPWRPRQTCCRANRSTNFVTP